MSDEAQNDSTDDFRVAQKNAAHLSSVEFMAM